MLVGEMRRSFPSASGVCLREWVKFLECQDEVCLRSSATRAAILPDQSPFYQPKSVLRKKITSVGAQTLEVVAQMEVLVATLPGFVLKSPGLCPERRFAWQ
jgi:hypothetical protein